MAHEEPIYGVHPVLEILRTQQPVSRIYMARCGHATETIDTLARAQRMPILTVRSEAIQKMAGTPKHQGVLAMVPRRSHCDIEDLLAIPIERNEPPFFLVIDAVEDPRNLGALLRTAEASGIHGVILPNRRAAGLSPVVSKASAGAMAHLAIVQVTNLGQTLDRLKKEAIWIVGLDARAPCPYWKYDFREPLALVVGSEGAGMHAKIRERCDALLSLPMRGVIESLNVSVAAGIVAYEALRQRFPKTR